MGTRSDSTSDSGVSEYETYDISVLFENNLKSNIEEDLPNHDITGYSVHHPNQYKEFKGSSAYICADLNSQLTYETKDEVEKYKDIAFSYFSKYEDLNKKCSHLEYAVEELKSVLDETKREKNDAIKEKENIVIKYAVGEKKILTVNQQKEKAEKKCIELHREIEILQNKIRILVSEKARICKLFDDKANEHKTQHQEYDKLKSEMSLLENELKWCQNNLKNEIDAHKESQKTIENLKKKVHDGTEEMAIVKREAEESIKAFKYSEENKAFFLEQLSKEQQASLILLKHERDDREHQIKNLQTTLERLQSKQRDMLQENNDLSQKIQQLECERLESHHKLSELRSCADQQLQDAADLQMKSAQLEQYELQLMNEQEQLRACREQMNILKSRNCDLESDIDACRSREAELLSFTQQLTDKNVRLQSEFTALETKVHQLSSEQALIKRSTKEHETKASMLMGQLSEQKEKCLHEIDTLKKELHQEVEQNKKLKQQLADQNGENLIMKRKYEFSLKEIQKEFQNCRKKLDEYRSSKSNSSSSSSLSVLDRRNETFSEDNVKVVQPDAEIDKQTFIEHIVKLQRISARKSEKIDFLEEHVNSIIAELQKKSKLLQIYMLREQTGALTSNNMDNTKADLAKLNGIMASMYSSRVADEHLTLELSLDINRKLQAVLEDALLKNITLKKNVDTLGEEIDRLNKLLKC